jgi:hypothetical protein
MRCWAVIRVEVGLRQQVENKKEVGRRMHSHLNQFNLRTVEVVGQVGLIPSVVRKPMV